jgi:site-specific DNA recombinase
LAALLERARNDKNPVGAEFQYVDDGWSGSTLVRPALERLRDAAAAGAVDRLYVHSPDRLARRYVDQVVLVEELVKAGVEVVFLLQDLGQNPESALLLQVQGMISEYERARIMERTRRGKVFAAKHGSVNVLSRAPYGYNFQTKHENAGVSRFEVIPAQAEVVQKIFNWVGLERLSISEVARRLMELQVSSPCGKAWWSRHTVWKILQNPAYMGKAGFGKTRTGPRRVRLNPIRGATGPSQRSHTVYPCPPVEWVMIPVPALVSVELFEAVQIQLDENRSQSRIRGGEVNFLLQGLVKCGQCGYAYSGVATTYKAVDGETHRHHYYRCTGRLRENRRNTPGCISKELRGDLLEIAVWECVKGLLEEPERLELEYQRRLRGAKSQGRDLLDRIEIRMKKLRKTVSRLIDAYQKGWIEGEELELRLRPLRDEIKALEVQEEGLREGLSADIECRFLVGQFQTFALKIRANLENADWEMRRDITRLLVKRIEVYEQNVNIVFRVSPQPDPSGRRREVLSNCHGRGHHGPAQERAAPHGRPALPQGSRSHAAHRAGRRVLPAPELPPDDGASLP